MKGNQIAQFQAKKNSEKKQPGKPVLDQVEKVKAPDAEYLLKLEQYKTAQENLRRKEQDFHERQRKFLERKTLLVQQIAVSGKETAKGKLEEQNKGLLKRNQSQLLAALKKDEAQENGTNPIQTKNQRSNQLYKHQSDQRIKKAPLNLAKLGAQKDIQGLKHISEIGTKEFLRQRKRNILSLNREQYHSQGVDQVKIDAHEYQKMQQNLDNILEEQDQNKNLPQQISLSIGTTLGGTTKIGKKSYDEISKVPQKEGLFNPGLKSTAILLETVGQKVLVPHDQDQTAFSGIQQNQKKITQTKNNKINAQNEAHQLAEYEDEFDALGHDGAGELVLSAANQAILAREDRNFLQQHKGFKQFAAEDPDNRELWRYDEHGKKVQKK